MRLRRLLAIGTALLFLTVTVSIAQKQNGCDLFQQGLLKERAEGNVQAAIQIYERIVREFSSNRPLAAKALVQLGACYEKLMSVQARKYYEQVISKYGDQADMALEARARLDGLNRTNLAGSSGPATRQIWLGGSTADFGESAPTPDGRYIGFTDWETGDLGIRDLVSGTSRRLTNTGGWQASADFAEASAISPDGRQIAYGWFDNKSGRYELRVLPVMGGESASPRIVHRSEETVYLVPMAWTPDGKQILMGRSLRDDTNQIAMVSVQDGSVRVLKSIGSQWPRKASLSPDGRYLAYDLPANDKTAARDIFVMASDGSREGPLVESPADDLWPFWSPDGSQILFFSDRTRNLSLWTIAVEGGKPKGPPTLLQFDIGSNYPLGITQRGSLYYVSGNNQVNVYISELDPAGKIGMPPVLATERFVNSNFNPSWSPDGQYLAYYSLRAVRGDIPGSVVLVIRAVKTGEERDIPLRLIVSGQTGGRKWFPDGRSVLVVSRELQRPGLGYYRVNLENGAAESILYTKARTIISPELSPDGKTLFYTDRDTQQPNSSRPNLLLQFDLNTRRETVLKRWTNLGQYATSVAVSPDGSQLAYLFYDDATRSTSLEVMPATGGDARTVFRATPWLDGSRYNTLSWTPDRRYLLFVKGGIDSNAPTVLYRVPVAGGDAEPMGPSLKGNIKFPSVHPGGQKMIFDVRQPAVEELWVLENFLPKTSAAR